MKKLIAFALLVFAATPALASLKVGDKAPDFTAPATLGGKEFTFHLADALKKGPVVVYFYPAAFTQGCTVEAHEFATAIPQYQALGASVIGVSHDDIATLNKFSVSECQSKFPVAADQDRHIMKSYDATLGFLTAYASRTSYVVSQDGRIAFAYSAMDPDEHVTRTLKAIQDLRH
ncbi:MAG TPA: peroxiredoxin [Rhizomicrobium sp.]|jgi:peroxiredoxin|nr:peroxiredoxin [Rhizomicrobium sp.]